MDDLLKLLVKSTIKGNIKQQWIPVVAENILFANWTMLFPTRETLQI